jgi:dephospho-CoA kinase
LTTTIGLTGGIGAGKSAVSALLARHGAVIVDADAIARQVVEPGGAAYEAVVARFGPGVTLPSGAVDRAALAAIVFSDPSARADLESLVHPAVGREIVTRLAGHAGTDDVIVLDVPLLVEAGGRRRYPVDGLLVVDVPEDLAVERLVSVRGMSAEDARARIAAQASRAERLRQADYVILNIGSLDELEAMVEKAWEWIEGLRSAA